MIVTASAHSLEVPTRDDETEHDEQQPEAGQGPQAPSKVGPSPLQPAKHGLILVRSVFPRLGYILATKIQAIEARNELMLKWLQMRARAKLQRLQSAFVSSNTRLDALIRQGLGFEYGPKQVPSAPFSSGLSRLKKPVLLHKVTDESAEKFVAVLPSHETDE